MRMEYDILRTVADIYLPTKNVCYVLCLAVQPARHLDGLEKNREYIEWNVNELILLCCRSQHTNT